MMSNLADTRGITLVEVLTATVVTGLLAAALTSAAHVILETDREAERAWQASELGLALLEEIAALPFDDPQTGSDVLGPDADEWSPPANRSAFDDVDDYTVWNGALGLQDKSGNPLSITGYTRSVTVMHTHPASFGLLSVSPTDYKLITVNVYADGELVRTFKTVRVQGGRDVDLAR